MKKCFLFTACTFAICLTSCFTDDDLGPEVEDVEYINNWIYETLSDVYLWEDELPTDPNTALAPTDFFESILYSGDRFSFIHSNYDTLVSSLGGLTTEAGYEIVLRKGETDDVYAIVTYVKNGSPAKQADLRRGDRITHINGTAMNINNYLTLISQRSQNHQIDYIRYDLDNNAYISQSPMLLSTTALQENPNFLDTIYSIQGKKIGYYVYHFFNNGDRNVFDYEMDEIISNFKDQGVTDLILDLRYNSGGLISSATNLASLIVANATSEDVFYQNQWNDHYQEIIESTAEPDNILQRNFYFKNNNIGDNINGKVYVLTGNNTASASELVINGLLPYMEIVLIGESTVGKNVGSIAIEDEENEENLYGLLPIVLESANSLGDSDYANGFFPNSQNTIFELDYPLLPLGDTNETLLAHAIADITGEASIATRLARPNVDNSYNLYSSRSDKAFSGRSIF